MVLKVILQCYVLFIIPIMIDRAKKAATDVILETTVCTRLAGEGRCRGEVSIQPITNLLFDAPNIITPSIISTLLELKP